MSRDKQIEEMAKDICGLGRDCHGCTASMSYICKAKKYAERAYDKGYRKASDLAEEIFAEIATILRHYDMLAERDKSEYGELIVMDIGCAIGELKKKYTEGEE